MKKFVSIITGANTWVSGVYDYLTGIININYTRNFGVAISKIQIQVVNTPNNYTYTAPGKQVMIHHKDTSPTGVLAADRFFRGFIEKRSISNGIINLECNDFLVRTQDKIGTTNYEDSTGTDIKSIITALCQTLCGITVDIDITPMTPSTVLKFDTTNQIVFGRLSYLMGLVNWYMYYNPVTNNAVFKPKAALPLQNFYYAYIGQTTNITQLPEWVDDASDVANDMIAVGGSSETRIDDEIMDHTDYTQWSNGRTYPLSEPYEGMTVIDVIIGSTTLPVEEYSTIDGTNETNLYLSNENTPSSNFTCSYLFNKSSTEQQSNNATSITQYGEKEKVVNDRKIVDSGDLSSLVSNLVSNIFWGKETEEVRFKVNESTIVPVLGSMAAVYDGPRNKSLVYNAGNTECIITTVSSSWPSIGSDTITVSTKSIKDPYSSSHMEDRYDGLAREVSEINPTELFRLTGEKALAGTMDCGHNQLINFRVHNVPTVGYLGKEASGQMQFNTTDKNMYYYNGTDWLSMGGINSGQGVNNIISNGDFESWSNGTSVAPDAWTLYLGSVYRITTHKIGTYAAALVRSGSDSSLQSSLIWDTHYQGKTMTVSVWAYSGVANSTIIQLYDGVNTTQSSYHTGVLGWELLTVTKTLSASATQFRIRLYRILDGTTFWDGAICVEGSTCPAFSPKPLIDDGATLQIDSINNKAKFEDIVVHGNSIYQNSTNANAALYINSYGYNGGITQFRDTYIRDGKNANIIFVDGSSKETNFYGDIDMHDNDITGVNEIVATASQDITFKITSGNSIIWQTV